MGPPTQLFFRNTTFDGIQDKLRSLGCIVKAFPTSLDRKSGLLGQHLRISLDDSEPFGIPFLAREASEINSSLVFYGPGGTMPFFRSVYYLVSVIRKYCFGLSGLSRLPTDEERYEAFHQIVAALEDDPDYAYGTCYSGPWPSIG